MPEPSEQHRAEPAPAGSTRRGLLAPAGAVLALLLGSRGWSKAASETQGQYVSLAPVALPIVLDGELINYIFVTVQLDAAPGADVTKLRTREPYFRDALIRASHRTPFVRRGDYTHIDEPALKSRLLAECARIAGPGQIISVEILSAQAQKQSGLPRGPSAPAAARDPIP